MSETKSRPKKKDKVVLRRGVRISVEDLKLGDRIVTRWHKPIDRELSEQQKLQVAIDHDYGIWYVAKSSEVKQIDECTGQWRTHIHVNRSDCYDLRFGELWIVDTSGHG